MTEQEIRDNKPDGAKMYAYIYGVVEYFKIENNKIMIYEIDNWIQFKNTTHESGLGTQFKPL